MFKSIVNKLIGSEQPSSAEYPGVELDPAGAALMRAVEEKRKTDPLIGAKIGGKEVFQHVLRSMEDERGVHIESLLCALGALAGYSCQASVRAQALENGLPETDGLIAVDTSSGKKYFFGEQLNQPLAESHYSVWGLAAGAAQHNGCKNMPDLKEIFEHVTETIGGDSFGIPRFPEGHDAADIPINYIKALWPVLLPVVKQFCQRPLEWPILYGLAVQEAIVMGKEALLPDIALLIVMESAVPMSKVDLENA